MTGRRRARILLADDHLIVRQGLEAMLGGEFEVVAAVEDGRALLREAERLAPDVIVLDIAMPGLNGIDATRQLRQMKISAGIVVLTMHADVTYATEVIEAGALGYVLKSASSKELVRAVRKALRGERYLAPEIADDMLPFLLNGPHQMNKRVSTLTPRQREVLQLIAEGNTTREIAALLSLSSRTVEFHKYRMMQDLGLHSTAGLTRYALRHGIVTN